MNIFIKKNNLNTTKLTSSHGIPYLEFPALKATGLVNAGFSTRLGGVSKGYLSSMNLGFNRGDDKETVMKNFTLMSKAMGFLADDIVKGQQTHTTNVAVVHATDRGKCFRDPDFLTDTDGLITNEPGVVLCASFADCVPLLILDPVKRVIGLSHSGWRGTVHYMGRATVEKMEETFGCDPQDMIACIGPSICKDCYEVSLDVATQFKYAFDDCYHADILEAKNNGKYQLDLWKANQIVFLKAGLRPQNIFIPDICTCCNSGVLYSHRASGGKRGNLAAFLELKDSHQIHATLG